VLSKTRGVLESDDGRTRRQGLDFPIPIAQQQLNVDHSESSVTVEIPERIPERPLIPARSKEVLEIALGD
jgi:hypothetical protein